LVSVRVGVGVRGRGGGCVVVVKKEWGGWGRSGGGLSRGLWRGQTAKRGWYELKWGGLRGG